MSSSDSLPTQKVLHLPIPAYIPVPIRVLIRVSLPVLQLAK